MALANDPTYPVVISLEMVDLAGQPASVKEFFVRSDVWDPATGLIADLKTIRDNLVTAVNAVTDALIKRAIIRLVQTEDTALVGAGQIENIASISCNTATAGIRRTVKIPAASIGVFLGATGEDSNRVDKTDADLLAFLEFFTDTDGSFFIGTDTHLADTAIVASGKRIHRGSVNG